ncbi:MAG: hypothetical protein V3R25_06005 [Nitrosomonadaceae bacterium]
MASINLKCIDVGKHGHHFTVGKLYKDAWVNASGKTISVVNDKNAHKIGPYQLNSDKNLQTQGCEFKIVLVANYKED